MTTCPVPNPPGSDPSVPETAPALPIRYRDALARLDALIQSPDVARDTTPEAIRARAEHRLARLRRLLAHLGDPQHAYPVVHVAGTSGKGSTATAAAAILRAAGYCVGLHTSPYLQVATEKLQIDGRLIPADAFADLVDDVLDAGAAWSDGADGGEALSYGEVWAALTFSWFARQRVDVAVVEVGAGGRFDLTNVVRPAVSVITSIGLDHTATLGGTIPEIAWHKAGIVKPGAPVVTAVTDPAALAPIEAEARAADSPVTRVLPGQTFEVVGVGNAGTRWRERRADGRPGPLLLTPLPGRFQATNAATAVAAVRALAPRGFPVDVLAVRTGLAAARLPGRLESMPTPDPPRVVLDGAHNPQKIGGLAADLPALLDLPPHRRPVVVFGAMEGKDLAPMLRLLAPQAASLVATAPRVHGKESATPGDIAAVVAALPYPVDVLLEPDPHRAVELALARARAAATSVLVTGSLYLAGAIRARWYPDAAIVEQRTPWPAVDA